MIRHTTCTVRLVPSSPYLHRRSFNPFTINTKLKKAYFSSASFFHLKIKNHRLIVSLLTTHIAIVSSYLKTMSAKAPNRFPPQSFGQNKIGYRHQPRTVDSVPNEFEKLRSREK